MNRYTDYDEFAWIYNQEFTFFAENIFPVLLEIARGRIPDKARILDLCCGTGQLAKVLTEKGYSVTGIDGSEEMLRFARINAPDAEFSVNDARAFRLSPSYHAAFSTFDSLNHVMTIEELQGVFKNVAGCLVDGGIFIFDMNTEKAFETQWKGHKEVREKPDYLCISRGDYNPEKRLAQYQFTLFRPKGKSWKRTDIMFYQTFYSPADIKSALEEAGFTNIEFYTFDLEHGLHEPTDESTRLFYLAEKP